MINTISIKTKFGWISVSEIKGKIFKIKFGKTRKQTQSKTLHLFRKNLNKFLLRKSPYIKANYKTKGNKIQKKIWNELKKIQFGSTTTYGTIAKKYKLSPRYVGKICSQNKLPLVIPCHRVIKSDGTLGGFTVIGGVKLKKKILEFEKFK